MTCERGQNTSSGPGVIDPDANAALRDVKTERVIPFDLLKGRDIEDFLRAQAILARDGALIWMVHEVTVTLAKGIRDLGNHGNQRACFVAKPEADRIEDVSQKTWLGKKLDPINPIRTVRGQGYRFTSDAAG